MRTRDGSICKGSQRSPTQFLLKEEDVERVRPSPDSRLADLSECVCVCVWRGVVGEGVYT